MKQLLQAVTSKTVLSVALMFVTAGFQATSAYFTPGTFTLIMGVLGLAATFFKVNPSQPYGKNV